MALGALGLLTGACGGGTKSAGVPGAGVPGAGAVVSSTTASSGPYRQPHTSRAGAGGAITTSRTASTPGSSRPASSAGPQQSEELKLARCMRAHGVPKFPDPPADGLFLNAFAASGVDPNTPIYQSALRACKEYNPAGNVTAQSAAGEAKALRFSQCRRSHGVPSFPDPTAGPIGEQVIDLHGRDIDVSSPSFQAASRACGGLK